MPLAYRAKRVLIIGGGDGGTLKRVLAHDNIEEVVIVDLDRLVVDVSREHFPNIASSFDDPRVKLIIADGARWLSEYLGVEYREERVREQVMMDARSCAAHAGKMDEDDDGSDNDDGHITEERAFDVAIVDSTDFGVAKSLFTRTFTGT